MLSLAEIATMRNARADVNHETYKLILEQCMHTIRPHVLYSNSVDYTLPPWIPGRPLYDLDHAIRYLTDKLSYHGYTVTRKGTHTIKVGWKGVQKRRKCPPAVTRNTTPAVTATAEVLVTAAAPPPPAAPSSTTTENIVHRLQNFNKQVKRIVLR